MYIWKSDEKRNNHDLIPIESYWKLSWNIYPTSPYVSSSLDHSEIVQHVASFTCRVSFVL